MGIKIDMEIIIGKEKKIVVLSDLHIGIPGSGSNDFRFSDKEICGRLKSLKEEGYIIILLGDIFELLEPAFQAWKQKVDLSGSFEAWHEILERIKEAGNFEDWSEILERIKKASNFENWSEILKRIKEVGSFEDWHKRLEEIKFEEIKKEFPKTIGLIEEELNNEDDPSIIYVRGNHDNTCVIPRSIEGLEIRLGPYKLCFFHGHEADFWNRSPSSPFSIGSWIARCCGALEETTDPNLPEKASNLRDTIGARFKAGEDRLLAKYASRIAKKYGYDGVALGHTHEQRLVLPKGGRSVYVNTGNSMGGDDHHIDEVVIYLLNGKLIVETHKYYLDEKQTHRLDRAVCENSGSKFLIEPIGDMVFDKVGKNKKLEEEEKEEDWDAAPVPAPVRSCKLKA